MRKAQTVLLGLALLAGGLLSPKPCRAHQVMASAVGTNRDVEVRIKPGQVTIVLSFVVGQLPALAELRKRDTNGDGRLSDAEINSWVSEWEKGFLAGLILKVGANPIGMRSVDRAIKLRSRQVGALPVSMVLKFQGRFERPLDERKLELTFRDPSSLPRLLRSELHFKPRPPFEIKEALVAGLAKGPRSRFLFEGPPRGLAEDREVRLILGRSGVAKKTAAPAPKLKIQTAAGSPPSKWDLATLLARGDRSLPFVLMLLGLAFVWGAVHALSPGHGKTLVAAYLVGNRGTVGQAVLLGLVVTVSHTAGVLILGVVALVATNRVLTTTVADWTSVVSGAAVAGLGLWLLRKRLKGEPDHHHGPGGHTHGWEQLQEHHEHGEHGEHGHGEHGQAYKRRHHEHEPGDHSHGDHDHEHDDKDHTTAKTADGGRSTWEIVTLGFTGGIVPCPSALVVLLAAVSLGRVGLGVVMILIFSAGLAGVLVAIGVVMVKARATIERFRWSGPWITRRLPVASAIAVAVIGLVLLARGVARLT